MTKKSQPRCPGAPQELISRINHLQQLLRNLPASLPLNPVQTRYQFFIDDDERSEYGPLGALSRCFETCFETFKSQGHSIVFTERGQRLDNELIQFMKTSVKDMSEADRSVFQDAWLERLIQTAMRHGATAKKRKRAATTSGSGNTTVNHDSRVSSDAPLDVDSGSDSEPLLLSATAHKPGATSSPKTVISRTPKALKQTSLAGIFKPITAYSLEELKLQKEREDIKRKAEQKKVAKRERKKAIEKEEHQKKLLRDRVQAFRARKKAKLTENSKDSRAPKNKRDANKVLIAGLSQASSISANEIIQVSRPEKEWRTLRSGKLGGTVQMKPKRTNWFHPFLWVPIDLAMNRADWSSSGAVKLLQREQPELFQRIYRGTIHKWKEDGENAWSARTLAKIKLRHELTGSGRTGVLAAHPGIISEIKKALQSLRTSSLPVNVIIGRSIMVPIIKQMNPSLLSPTFQCSERFVRSFFQSVMGWTPRQATRAAAHIPTDAAEVCERAFFRLVYAIKWEDIPLDLVINADQMGMYVLPSNSRTFHDKGADQVDVHGKQEKRAYTLMVSSTPSGLALPFQQVWSGKTPASLPSDLAPGKAQADSLGIKFHVAASPTSPRSHFSTLKTMKEWVTEVIIPHRKSIIERDKLPSTQKIILYIDCYAVHLGEPFRTWVHHTHPFIILIYVPANCTGIFQPADVALQRPIKHILKQALFRYLVTIHQRQIASGLDASEVSITTSLPKLRDTSVQGLVNAHTFLTSPDGRDLIKLAWRKSTAKAWCLSAECLTSRAAKEALKEYLKKDTTLREEIEGRTGSVNGLEAEVNSVDEECPDADDDMDPVANDDSDIPLHSVIKNIVGRPLGRHNSAAPFTVSKAEDNGDGLMAGNDDEDVWQFTDDGRRWVDSGELPETDDDSDSDSE